jgi:hypothetical protein
VQQQVGCNAFQQPVGADQLPGRIALLPHGIDRQCAEQSGDQPHRPLPDRVAAIDLLELLGVGAREPFHR